MATCTMKSYRDEPFDLYYRSGKKSSVSAYQKMSFVMQNIGNHKMKYTINGVEKTNKICLMSGLSYLPFESNIDFLIRNNTNEKDIRVNRILNHSILWRLPLEHKTRQKQLTYTLSFNACYKK